jgi:hypothetical protein
VNPKEKVPLGQGARLALFVPGAGILAALHQHPAPSVWGRIEENAKFLRLAAGYW